MWTSSCLYNIKQIIFTMRALNENDYMIDFSSAMSTSAPVAEVIDEMQPCEQIAREIEQNLRIIQQQQAIGEL